MARKICGPWSTRFGSEAWSVSNFNGLSCSSRCGQIQFPPKNLMLSLPPKRLSRDLPLSYTTLIISLDLETIGGCNRTGPSRFDQNWSRDTGNGLQPRSIIRPGSATWIRDQILAVECVTTIHRYGGTPM